MAIGSFSRIRGQMTAWRRLPGICACLLALAMLVFGHLDPPSMPVSHGGHAVMSSAGHAASRMSPNWMSANRISAGRIPSNQIPHGHAAAFGHCVHHGNCAFYGVVPVVFTLVPPPASAQLPADDRSGSPRVISPLQHPPKVLGA